MSSSTSATRPDTRIGGGVGEDVARPDGGLKVRGEFAFSSDLWMDGMLWGTTLRSPHPHARIVGIRTEKALAVTGVFAVLTHEDVPGVNAYGLEHRDQPVLAHDRVRYQGEPVALVAADHPETARRAAALIEVDDLRASLEAAEGRGLQGIIAGAGGAAHLPGMLASKTLLPVLGVPIA